jgi:signal transduction histidine kinase
MHFSDVWMGGYPLSRLLPERLRPREGEPAQRGEPLAAAAAPGTISSQAGPAPADRAELERLNESLLHAQRLAGIGTLTAGVAHELTNPISIITTACANLLDELNEESVSREELAESIRLIEQSAFRCARIVDVLRHYAHDMSREESDSATIAVTSPAMVVDDALTMVEQQFRKRTRVTVEVDLQHSLTTIFCDHHRITQILINLLINARDAMQPAGGVARVRFWTPDPANDSHLIDCFRAASSRDPADLFAFAVADSGSGIAPGVMARLFEPFFTTKPNGQGTGLGLFICKGIVTQHGGCIYAENNPDGGATFTVVLPRRP